MIESEPEQLVTDLIEQKFIAVAAAEKLAFLLWILRCDNADRVLVFCNRRDACQRLARQLGRYGVQCGLLSGDVPQEKRLKILERFRSGTTPVIVATDVAARGIHVDSVTHVVNYDMPYESDDYVHRVGRTGGAGETGKSIGFVCEYGAHMIPALEKLLGHPIACEYPTEEMVTLPRCPRSPPRRRPPRRSLKRPRRRRGVRRASVPTGSRAAAGVVGEEAYAARRGGSRGPRPRRGGGSGTCGRGQPPENPPAETVPPDPAPAASEAASPSPSAPRVDPGPGGGPGLVEGAP